MNNKVFIICVTIDRQVLRYRFENTIIGTEKPKRIMENVYALVAPYSFTSEQVRNTVNVIFNNDCDVFVMKTSIDASWRLEACTDNWLRSNL